MPKSLMNDEPQTTHSTAAVHLSLQGKGGVGKSLVASFLAQFYKAHGVRAICVDTDPVNQTFSQYAALGAQHLRLMDGNQIDRRRFDSLLDSILTSDESFIIDNGASTFLPLWHYMVEGRIPVSGAGRRAKMAPSEGPWAPRVDGADRTTGEEEGQAGSRTEPRPHGGEKMATGPLR